MRRAINRRFMPDNQPLEIRFFRGFSRQQYISSLFRQIRDIENGALRDIESDDNITGKSQGGNKDARSNKTTDQNR